MKYFVALLFLFLQISLKAQDDIVNISIDPNKTFQKIHGFGASDSWRVKFVGKYWPLDKRNKIADLLFSTEVDEDGNPIGIGLSTWRFYLGAGSFEQGEASQIANEWRRAECFLTADGSYDWNRHEGQRWFLHAANKRGVPNFLAYPISPPMYFTKNGLAFASKGDTGFNLEPARYHDYAKYLATVIRHFDEVEGIHFDYLSPFNEPQ
jgi:O-glycosyl hydrolase